MKHVLNIALLLFIPLMGFSQSIEEINKSIVGDLDEIAPFSEGLAAVKKGNQWGFINEEGELVIGFRDDLVWNKTPNTMNNGIEGIGSPQFKNGLCSIKKMQDDGIARYGFMDKTGKVVVAAEFLNVSQFNDGYAIGIYESKSLRGKNPFQLKIYDYAFTEIVVNEAGELLWPIQERDNIVMSKKLYNLPELQAQMISSDLLKVKSDNNKWKIVKPKLDN